jgi:hypothetical protein
MANEYHERTLQKSLPKKTSQVLIASFLVSVAITTHADTARSDENMQRVTTIGHWSIECDAKPTCIAVGVLPPRKVRMTGQNAALEIEFTHERSLNHGLRLLKLDGPSPIHEIQLSPAQADLVLRQLTNDSSFLIWVPISASEVYYVPGRGFSTLLEHVRRAMPEYAFSGPQASQAQGPLN